jgi:hypothetical protein
MFASTLENGMCQVFPDTCKTPTPAGPVPTPYPNIVNCPTAQSSSCASKVMINGMKAFNKKTSFPSSQGDQAGTLGGIVSSKIMGEVKYTSGSSSVYIQGPPAVKLSDSSSHNGSPPNASMGSQIVPSQRKVMIMS